MKTEINNENKERFFAQYWGVECLCIGGVGLVKVGYGGWNLKHPDFFLELKPISSISGEDSIEVGSEVILQTWSIEVGSEVILQRWLYPWQVDYLRSKGYLLPWMGLSPDEIIEAGWVKYKI